MVYRGAKTKQISFPLGGIGTGCIGLSGNGRLIDWEIYNRPAKGSVNGFSHIAVRAEREGRPPDCRVLNSDLQPPYMGEFNRPYFQQYGFGPDRMSMAGFPHFETADFYGEFPVARLDFHDDTFPGKVRLTAFNPFIPLNDKDSSIPAAFFEVELCNDTCDDIGYTVVFNLGSQAGQGESYAAYSKEHKNSYLTFYGRDAADGAPGYSDMTIATDADDISYQEYWYRGMWFDSLAVYWKDLARCGRFANRSYGPGPGGFMGAKDTGLLAAHLKAGAGQTVPVRFVLSWSSPVFEKFWGGAEADGARPSWKNYYAALFENSRESARYSLDNWDRLHRETVMFKNALFSSTIPDEAKDAVSANLSVLKSPTCLRLEDGSFYGFEGAHVDLGSCEGSCTHVWNYACALPFLFPSLERSMRVLDYTYNQSDNGGMSFRLGLPLGKPRSGFRPCADGQFGGVIKTYRDWKISGDEGWLRSVWPKVKKSLEFAWDPSNSDKWDADKDGVLEGRQHHTLDMELFGPNSWLTGYYLGALKAASRIAAYLGEDDCAGEYASLFERGRAWVGENLFNGEYFQQKIDLTDRSLLEKYGSGNALHDVDTEQAYWNEEAGEIKYQIGRGCGVDQVVAQWHANLCGLGELFDKRQARSALESIYRYNFKPSMRYAVNPCRIFSLNDEGGTVIYALPEGVEGPEIPVPYAEETMTGFEYQAAVHMLQEGMADEGLELIRAVRSRFDGERRNPFNEFECGSNYARSLASYSILNALGGFSYDMSPGHGPGQAGGHGSGQKSNRNQGEANSNQGNTGGEIGFAPVRTCGGDEFRIFWSLDSGWGMFSSGPDGCELSVLYGKLIVKKLTVNDMGKSLSIVYDEPVTINGGSSLKASFNKNSLSQLFDILE